MLCNLSTHAPPSAFGLTVPTYVLQSSATVAFSQSRVKTPLFGAVSVQRPFGVP